MMAHELRTLISAMSSMRMKGTRTVMTKLSYISPRATIRDSPIHGRGLFAVAPIARGDIVAMKGGYIYERALRDTLQP